VQRQPRSGAATNLGVLHCRTQEAERIYKRTRS